MRSSLAFLALCLPVGCGDAAPIQPLHERAAFSGRIRVEGSDGPLTGRLAFDRASRNLQFSLEGEDGGAVSLLRGPEHPRAVRAFAEPDWRTPTESEKRCFRLIEAIVLADPGTDWSASDDGYRVRTDRGDVVVRILEAFDGHGK